MPIPRYKDAEGKFEVYLICNGCGWCIPKDRLTEHWKECRQCGGKLRTARTDFYPPYKTTYADGKPYLGNWKPTIEVKE
jgi:hypothetical protein